MTATTKGVRDVVGGLEIVRWHRHWGLVEDALPGGRWAMGVQFHRRRDAVAARRLVLAEIPGGDVAAIRTPEGKTTLSRADASRVDSRIRAVSRLVRVVVERHRQRRCLECGSFGSCREGQASHAPRREISAAVVARYGPRPDESGPLLTSEQVAWAR